MTKMDGVRIRFTIVSCLLFAPWHVSAATVSRYDVYEIQFTGPADPTSLIDGTFTHSSGRKITMPAFWDGGTTWRCRFAPIESGNWTYIVADRRGEIACTPGNNPGFIRPDGRHFRYDDGTYVHILGNTHYDLMRCSESVIDEYIAWDCGSFNKVRMAVVTQRYHGDTKAFENGNDDNGYDFHKPVAAYWQKLDRTVVKMQKAGIIADLILAGPDITYQQLKDDFYKRYVVARYAAYSNVRLMNAWRMAACCRTYQPRSLRGFLNASGGRSRSGKYGPFLLDIQATDPRSAVKIHGSTSGAASIDLSAGPSDERVYLIGGKPSASGKEPDR